MLDRLQRSSFLRPKERMFELLLLQHADRNNDALVAADVEGVFDQRTLHGFITNLVARGLLLRDGDAIQLTPSGRERLRYLLVDYVRELARLNEGAHDILRRSLAPLALAGVKRVAFYPFGETAEVAFAVLPSLGLELVALVDDSPQTWGIRFHHLRVQQPNVLTEIRPDAVIVTTAVFQDAVLERLKEFPVPDMRVHVL